MRLNWWILHHLRQTIGWNSSYQFHYCEYFLGFLQRCLILSNFYYWCEECKVSCVYWNLLFASDPYQNKGPNLQCLVYLPTYESSLESISHVPLCLLAVFITDWSCKTFMMRINWIWNIIWCDFLVCQQEEINFTPLLLLWLNVTPIRCLLQCSVVAILYVRKRYTLLLWSVFPGCTIKDMLCVPVT